LYEHLALSDNGFLFDTRTGTTYSLNSTGTWLLRALMRAVPRSELACQMVESFEVDAITAHRDVDQFLFRLRELRLVADSPREASR